MKHNHSSHDAIHTNPEVDMPDKKTTRTREAPPTTDPLTPPRTDKWDGQILDLKPGTYKASWQFKKKEKGKYKGCKIRTYEFIFSKDSEKSMTGINGEFTIHSRKSGSSIRTKIDIFVDQNGDGEYSDDEVLVSSGKEGYRVRDAITDHTTSEFRDALDLRRIEKSGQLTFDNSLISSSYYAPDINFKNFDQKQVNEFSVNFTDYNNEDIIVC